MTVEDLLARLGGVRPRGPGRWLAKCASHADKTPSLSVTEGERGILLRCWAGCSLDEICQSLGVAKRELFFDAFDTDPRQRRAAAAERRQRDISARKRGQLLDTCKLAQRFLESRRGMDISMWTDDRLDRELNLVADALQILEHDLYGC